MHGEKIHAYGMRKLEGFRPLCRIADKPLVLMYTKQIGPNFHYSNPWFIFSQWTKISVVRRVQELRSNDDCPHFRAYFSLWIKFNHGIEINHLFEFGP